MVCDPTTVRTKELRKPTKEQHYYATNLDMLLTHDEIIDLTGYKQPKKQCEHLLSHGIRFLPGRDGRPRVSRAFLERLLGGKTHKSQADLDGLKKFTKKTAKS